ncbi:DNA mismatch repair protein MutS [uncultured Pontibacter sp.]|uniref:MutS-related protein n=1 Tax=uncultured Pontibacter sp. TaxID=453356 RepID=UPI002610876C|nr:DNA mismatch repair protein MutS [uncultured Pontibacter sp.]
MKQAEEDLHAKWSKAKEEQYFNFPLIKKYFKNKLRRGLDSFQVIPDKVSEDLYLDEVFEFVDRTVSKVGQQFLYYKLRVISGDIEELRHFDRLVDNFSQNEEQRKHCQLTLRTLEKGDSFYLEELIHGEPIKPPKWYPLVYVLTFSVLVLTILAFIFPVLLFFLLPLFVANILIHYWNKENINYYLIALGEFSKAYNAGVKLSNVGLIKSHFADTGFLQRLIPLKKKMRWVSLNNKLEDETTTIFYSLFELLKMAFNLEIIFFFSLIEDVEKKRTALDELFQFIGEIDAAISTASYRAGLEVYCKPSFCEPKQLKIDSLTHPLLANCIPNDLQLSQKGLLLTGSNMSGKTTFIRSVGINMLLAQTIYTCTASNFIAPFSRIFTSVKISDDLLTEKSYYFEEVSTIKAFIDSSHNSEPAIFILDEIFKGTNTVERISGGKAILSYLAKRNHLVFVSTHDIELTELLQREFDLYHFSESIHNTQLVFDHKLKFGPLRTRNAIKILQISGYPSEIVEEANSIVSKIENVSG